MSRHNRRLYPYQLEVLSFDSGHGNLIGKVDPRDIRKPADMESAGTVRTVVKRFEHQEQAKIWASRFGTVISCQKVDTVPYTRNIEFLNLHQEPVPVPLDRDEFTLTPDLQLVRGKGAPKILVEVIDKGQ